MATLSEIQAELAKYRAARDAILTGGQSYTVDGITYSRGTLFRLEKTIGDLEHREAIALRSGRLPHGNVKFGGWHG